MFNGAALVRRTTLSKKVYEKAAEMKQAKPQPVVELVVEEKPSVNSDAAPIISPFSLPTARIKAIQITVAKAYGVSVDELLSERRQKYLAEARHIAMWLARKHTPRSFPQIGGAFRRDHTSVISAINKISAKLERERDFCIVLQGIERELFRSGVIDGSRDTEIVAELRGFGGRLFQEAADAIERLMFERDKAREDYK